MSCGGRPQHVAQALLDGMPHDARYNWLRRMSNQQRNTLWINERAIHPDRWFHHRGREHYHRDAVDGVAPVLFLLRVALTDANDAARAACRSALVATRHAARVVDGAQEVIVVET